MRVLLTSMGSTAAQNLVWALRQEGAGAWFVVGADVRAVHGGMDLPDVPVTVPPGDDAGYVPALERIVAGHGIDLLVPVMEPELLAVARAGPALGSRCRVLIASREAVEVCRSKRRLVERFDRAGLDPPRLLDPSENAFPLFARPDLGSGSRGSRVVRDRDELHRVLAEEPGLVLTEHVDGEELSVDGFADPDGALVHAICRRRDEVRRGLAVRSTVVEMDEQLWRRIDALSRELGLFGFFNTQFRRDATGRARFFDLNPRLGGAMALSFAAGLDAPRLLRRVLNGGEEGGAPFETRVGLRLERRYHNVIVG